MRLWAMMAGALLAASGAEAATYSNLFVFGDSLVDSGNAHRADPTQGYVDGRFSNGPNFADVLSTIITGRAAAPVLKEGTGITDLTQLTRADLDPDAHNFAVGGAQAAEVVGDRSPSLVEQVGLLGLSGQRISSDSLVLLSIGGNDVRAAVPGIVATFAAELAAGRPLAYTPDFTAADDALSDALRLLIGAGARNIILVGVPDIGQIPAVTGLPLGPLLAPVESEVTAVTRAINADFQGVLKGKSAPGLNLDYYDLFGQEAQLFRDVQAAYPNAPLNTTTPCLLTGAAPTCNDYVYYDAIHPTQQVHAAIGDAIARQLDITAVPEPAAWMLMIVGFGLVGSAQRRRPAAVPA